jgi:acetylornithine aminotransferase
MKVRERTLEVGALLAVDEVQTGMGRTGEWFAYQREGITPDIITLAKGLGGGLPLGATIGIGRAAALLQAGSHGSTFGGSPTSVAAALAAIKVLKSENLLDQVKKLGEVLINEGSQIPGVKEVRGSGLLIGIEFERADGTEIQKALEKRLILVNAPSAKTIRIAPALITNLSDVHQFLTALQDVLVGAK